MAKATKKTSAKKAPAKKKAPAAKKTAPKKTAPPKEKVEETVAPVVEEKVERSVVEPEREFPLPKGLEKEGTFEGHDTLAVKEKGDIDFVDFGITKETRGVRVPNTDNKFADKEEAYHTAIVYSGNGVEIFRVSSPLKEDLYLEVARFFQSKSGGRLV